MWLVAPEAHYTVHRAVEDRTPVPVHLAVAQLGAARFLRRAEGGGGVTLQVLEGATEVQVPVADVQGLHLHR